ncbi:glyoxalase/bleomycin resistance protein/dioxygenase superfamily protein [Saccharothrix saharensis]|uniref:Glyoxalase/bleomycin resistance protein/dioxygenase superfamily protein n=1 Tax=Saccharothrix saharensis TaxID=571190 RepID=A0A543J5A9_9PSEU|nr:glyoxalase/bleomycin resistance protein/dioxygenase superfamily protein [Saccharothrix saharensis]
MKINSVLKLTATVLDAPDAQALARFYRDLLGWPLRDDEPGWATLRPADGGAGLSFQTEPDYQRPTWPAADGRQRMMAHLDILVDDLETTGAHAVALGATLADFQPQEGVRVYLDPAGHPFCLFLEGW